MDDIKWEDTQEFAHALDAEDPCRPFRNEFEIPRRNGRELIYFCGNSLGLLPKRARKYVEQELNKWAELAVDGHFAGEEGWFGYHHLVEEMLAQIVGAHPEEVVAMNSLTTNLHLLMVSFYQPTPERAKILIESSAFPSDRYAVVSQIEQRGYSPQRELIEIAPRPGEYWLRTEDILTTMESYGSSLALVLLGGVNYITGEVLDMAAITQKAQELGAVAAFDLAHGVGNIELHLHQWNVDFAVWCSYKYLNSGPGSIGGAFVHRRHLPQSLPRFAGWWGQKEEIRFEMGREFVPMANAGAWQLSNPPILSLAAHRAALELFQEAGLSNLWQKSKKLTAYLDWLLRNIQQQVSPSPFKILTPRERRGCQISLLVPPTRQRASAISPQL